MYVKSLYAKVLVREERVILCNIKNGSFVKTSRSYFEYLEKLLEDSNGKFIVNKKDSIVKRNAYKLFQELCRICFYIPKEQLKQDNEFLYQIVYLSLTDRCNLRCKHCVASACIDKTDHMDTEDWKKVITQVVTLNPEQINLTGGEPLIRPDFCEILKYLRINYKGTITLSTNALLLDDKLTEMIKENVDGVSVSLDGFDDYSCAKVRGDGVYDRVITGVRKLKKAGVENVSISMLRTKYTYGHDNEFYKLCEELDAKPLIRRFAPSGRGEENQEELLPPMEYIDKLEKHHLRCALCQPGKKELNISENGDVYPCSPLSSMKTLLMGNLLEVPIAELIEEPEWKQELEKLRPWKMEQCKDCDVNLFCHSCINFIHGMQSNLEEDPYEGVTKISLKNMFDQNEDDYYVYFYMVQCPFCNQVKDGMLHFAAENNNVYFVDYAVKENRPLQKYNWAATRSKYNKKIGYIDDDGNKVFLYGESEEKYKNMKNDYGKLMRFNFVTITQKELSSFPGSNVGDIYTDIQTPEIDYASITNYENMLVAGVPVLFRISNGVIIDFYFDSVEIDDFLNNMGN